MSRRDLSVEKGQTFARRFYVMQKGGLTTVGDLTGFAVTGDILDAEGTVVDSFVGSVITAASALCQIALTAAQTLAITAGNYTYVTDVTSGSTNYKPLNGFFVVSDGV